MILSMLALGFCPDVQVHIEGWQWHSAGRVWLPVDLQRA